MPAPFIKRRTMIKFSQRSPKLELIFWGLHTPGEPMTVNAAFLTTNRYKRFVEGCRTSVLQRLSQQRSKTLARTGLAFSGD